MDTIDLALLAERIFETVENNYLKQRITVHRVHRFASGNSSRRKCHYSRRDSLRRNCADLIGEEIKRRRQALYMTQEKLAQMIHIDAGQVSRHERGLQLTLNILPLYAEALGCSVQDLLPGRSPERMFSALNERMDTINDLFPEILELPPEERDQVLNIVETTLRLALRK